MPIFMDLHFVPGITAQGVAEAHRQDLLIQEKYNCNCMTYWVDESKGSAFCLIQAPNAKAVRALHNEAHGLMTHQIIQVNEILVESFLGRIYDPETPVVPVGQLKIFNDPAFRILVLVKISDPVLLMYGLGKPNCDKLLGSYENCIASKSKEFEGIVTEFRENFTSILSFSSAVNAVTCALSIQSALSEKEREVLDLKISINAGMPVTQNQRIFGDTIETGEHLLYLAKPSGIVVASIITEILPENFFNRQRNSLTTLSSSREKLLSQLFDVLDKNSSEENFSGFDFCKYMALSKSGLNRLTHALAGKTPNELLKDIRLKKALQLLRKKSHNVSQIAFATGFSSPSYFSKCFKFHFQIAPSVYVRWLKKAGETRNC